MPIALNQFIGLISELMGYIALSNSSRIYRGEPECYPEVSSNLWRKYTECHYHDDFDIEGIQKEIVAATKKHIPTLANNRVTIPVHLVEDDHKRRVAAAESALVTWRMIEAQRDLEILTDIQHYGGETNLIDFTRDYLIAFFFACNNSFNEDGRIIILNAENNNVKKLLKEPSNPQSRIIAQKSVFIEPPKGFIEKNLFQTIRIPKDYKHYILDGLRIFHNISAETIYNDLHGFITYQKARQEPCGVHDAFHRGLNHHLKADRKKRKKKKNKHYDKALKFYDQALTYNSTYHQAYNKKGLINFNRADLDEARKCFEYGLNCFDKRNSSEKVSAESYRGLGLIEDSKGNVDGAIRKYKVAIEKHPDYHEAYVDRSAAYFKKGDQKNALEDWLKVQSLRRYPDFEKKYGVKLPGHRKIRAFTIFGRRICVKTWREMVKQACTEFIGYESQYQPDMKERLLSYTRFSEQSADFRAGQQISRSSLYVETHGDSHTLQKFMTRLITEFEYHEDSLTFEIFID